MKELFARGSPKLDHDFFIEEYQEVSGGSGNVREISSRVARFPERSKIPASGTL
jgi:hypothetical protein